MSDPIIATRYHLRDAADSLVVAIHKDGPAKNPHLQFARNSIAKALMPDAEGMPYLAGEEWLIETIAEAIADSVDIDVTYEDQARFVVDALFKHLKPEGE